MPSTGTPSVHTTSGRAAGALVVHALVAARQDDAPRRERADERVVHVPGMDLAIDVRLAQAARDQLRHLRAEVEDQDAGVASVRAWRRRRSEKAGGIGPACARGLRRVRLREVSYSTR